MYLLDEAIHIENVLKTDLFLKATDTHQSLESLLYHPYRCEKDPLYSASPD